MSALDLGSILDHVPRLGTPMDASVGVPFAMVMGARHAVIVLIVDWKVEGVANVVAGYGFDARARSEGVWRELALRFARTGPRGSWQMWVAPTAEPDAPVEAEAVLVAGLHTVERTSSGETRIDELTLEVTA